jgi:hypothetical protein
MESLKGLAQELNISKRKEREKVKKKRQQKYFR